uniref:Uncharacterized protein n=1 Tax=Anguilla anguilla TaxID=7936 RepID=A0A0E9SRN0_ANGAN
MHLNILSLRIFSFPNKNLLIQRLLSR